MRYALDDNGAKIEPSHSGQKAKCILCKGTVIGKCGEIYVWHWQHQNDRVCDPWKEHETEWHRNWKAKFPIDWQEVIIENYYEKHIADIKTADGTVIEFQNSSISSGTIRVRENFYRDMIWVVNAITFKDKFKKLSLVQLSLRTIEREYYKELKYLEDSYKADLKRIAQINKKSEQEINRKIGIIKSRTNSVDKLQEILINHETFTNEVIKKWSEEDMYWGDETYDVANKINPESKRQLVSIPEKKKELHDEIKSLESGLQKINNLDDFEIEGKLFKILPYSNLPAESFPRARAILKKTKNSLFQEIVSFKTESEFKSYKYRQDQFDFAVDPTNGISNYHKKIDGVKISIHNLDMQLQELKNSIAENLVIHLKSKIQDLESQIHSLNIELDDLIEENGKQEIQQMIDLLEKEKEFTKAKKEIEKVKNQDIFKAMRKKKGFYLLNWKHERKSWKAASKTIYFDLGESNLYELINDDLLKRIDKSAFIERYL